MNLQPALAQDSATGNFLIAPSLLYYSGLRARTSEEKRAYSVYELKAAYQIFPEFFLGIAYQIEDESIENSGFSSASLNNSSKSKRTSLGPSIGYVTPSLHLMFTYFLDSKWNLNTTTSTAQSKYDYVGTGLQLDFGYKIPLWGFFFGPQISYKKFSYDKLSTDGAASSSISPKLEETSVEPSLVLYYFF
ncbi:MAG: autotransporter outer membrane beta-barrel domain-containing protein [Bdellovibrionales bacterium]|nr:autotransporter outer membrane beta-barrel domain-containing protein [Bdellovibrionales bacterium]